MPISSDNIYVQALDLPIDQRLILIDKLIHSTNLPASNAIDKAWILEINKRIKQLESGETKLISGNKVFEKIGKKYGK